MTENFYEKTNSIKELLDKNQAQNVIKNLKEIIKKKLTNFQEKLLLAKVYLEIKDYKNSLLNLTEILNSGHANYDVYYTLGNLFLSKKEYFHAIKYFIKSIRSNNKFAPSWLNLAYLCKEKGHLLFSEKFYKKTLEIRPDYIRAKFNISHVLLALKKFDKGFYYYENRWKWKDFKSKYHFKNLKSPKNLNDLNNQKIIIFEEQGFGDTFQFIRYLSLFLPTTKVYFATKKSLHKILSLNQTRYQLIDIEKPLVDNSIKFALPLLSLPFFFKKYEDCNNFTYPYIYTDKSKNEFWSKKINLLIENSKYKIGICFTGGRNSMNRDDRSFNARYFKKIFNNSSYKFFNLSNNKTLSTNSFINKKIIYFDFIDVEDKFLDTASIINKMDIILTIDTSIAHLSGSLNKKTILLLNFISDWRWGLGIETKWYENFIILKRKKFESWDQYSLRVEQKLDNELQLIQKQ